MNKYIGSLLIHFSSWCHTIDGHEKYFFGLDHSEQNFYVVKYVGENFLLRYPKVRIVIIRMGAIVNYTIHV